MKAKLLTISAAVMTLLAVSCQREETGFGLPAGEEVTVTLSASVPTGGPAVKSAENPGNGSEVNRCILGVYMVDGENGPQLYGTLSYEQVTGQQATFEDVTLLTGYDYKLVFWADNVESTTNLQTDNHYVTTDFPKVTYNTADGHQYMSSEDTRDAFYGVFDLNDFSGEVQDSYILTRPFGQLNIFTTDYDEIKSDALKPAKVRMTFTSIPTGMDLINGSLTEPAEGAGRVTGEISAIPDDVTYPVVTGAQQLSFDYIFAPEGQQRMISGITMNFYDANDSELDITAYSFPELPVQRNYRTNVSGALLTKSADLKIDISEDFDETLEKDVYTVSTLAEAGTILGKIVNSAAQPEIISITVKDQIPSTGGQNSIELPAITTEVELNLQGGIASDATLTVRDVMAGTDSGNDFIGRLVLNNASTEQQGSLVINLPEGSAEVAGGSYTSVQVTTADDTFVLGEGGYIETLTVNGGNVEIYGKVSTVVFGEDAGIIKVFTVYDEESFEYAMKLLLSGKCEKIVLGSDITYTAYNTLYTISGNKETSMDLNGYTLTLNGVRLYVDGGASVTFYDGTIEVINVSAGLYPLAVRENASMTLERVKILRTDGYAVGVSESQNGGRLRISECTIESLTYAVGTNAKSPVSQNVEIEIENSTLTGYTPLFLNIPLKASITGSTLKGSSQGMILRGGNATVKDCEILLETSEDINPLIKNEWGTGYEAHNASFEEHDWGTGNDVPNAALTIGNKGSGYQYPTVLNIENTSLSVTGPYSQYCHEVYVYANEETGMGVSIKYDQTTQFEEDVFYGNGGNNVTVNGNALDLSENVFEVSSLEELASAMQTLATSGGTLVIKEGADIELSGDTFSSPLVINEPTVIKVYGKLKCTNSDFSLKNNSTLKIEGTATSEVRMKRRVVENYGTLTVNGGTYYTDTNNGGTLFWNNSGSAVMTLNDVTANASFYCVAGMGRIEINGGQLNSTASNKNGEWAYCISAQDGCQMVIRDAEVNGVQGAISSTNSSYVLCENVRSTARNSDASHQDAFYALYAASDGGIEVLSGEYLSDRTPCCLVSDNDISSNPLGYFILKGGKYGSMPQIKNKNGVYSDCEAYTGYKFQEITGDSQFKYEIVAE